jgi:hypothetical protein
MERKKMNKLLVLVVVVTMMVGSAHATDWNFYGSARVQTFIEKNDSGNSAGSFTEYEQYLQTNSRIGARVKVNEQLTGRFEYGASSGNANIRLLYGEWDFGAGSLLIGQAYSPLNMFYSNQVWWDDTNLYDFGGVYSGRNPMLRLKFGDFQIAVLQPSTHTHFGNSTEVVIPKIEAKYKFSNDNWHLQIAGGYNSFEVLFNGVSDDVDSYILALGGGVNFGPAYIQGNVWYGQNVGNYGMLNMPFDVATFNSDNDAHAFVLVTGYKINEMFTIEAGVGYTVAKIDQPIFKEDADVAYYVQSSITLAPGVSVVPEIGLIDWKTDLTGADEGDIVYGGMKWQIDF